MIDSNDTMGKRVQIQAQIDNIVEIAGAAGLDEVSEACNAILTKLGVTLQVLTAAEREMAEKSGADLHALAFQKAKGEHRERVLASLSEEDQLWCARLGTDPLMVAAAKKNAEGELRALSFADRATLSRRCGGDVIAMVSIARNENLL